MAKDKTKRNLNLKMLDAVSGDNIFSRDSTPIIDAEEQKGKDKTATVKITKPTNTVLSDLDIVYNKFEKSSKKLVFISEENHSILSDLAKVSSENIMDILDSILTVYFNNNPKIKDRIKEEFLKKYS